ncbi:MAG: CBS domain-containing protein [Bacillus sp. (in: firmicutes)]
MEERKGRGQRMTANNQKSFSERFETAFNRIHKELKDTVKEAKSDKFTELVHEGRSHGFIRFYHDDLCQFAKLRNAIVHEKIDEGYYIAEPHEEVVEKIESIAAEFEKPSTALSISSKPVCYFSENDGLNEVLKAIRQYGYSGFPVFNERGQYQWFLTAASIVEYLASTFDKEDIDLKAVKVGNLYNEKKEYQVRFINQHAAVFEVEDIFDEFHKKNGKIEAVIITARGTTIEEPNGIITPSDLLKEEIGE